VGDISSERNKFKSLSNEVVRNMKPTTIYIPKLAFIFIVEDDLNRIGWFVNKLGSRIIGIHDKPENAIKALQAFNLNEIDMFFLDHDLGGPFEPPFTTDVAKYMIDQDLNIGKRTIIHSCNPAGARNLESILPGSTLLPFGTFDIEDKDV
jgi:hypothetical protein